MTTPDKILTTDFYKIKERDKYIFSGGGGNDKIVNS